VRSDVTVVHAESEEQMEEQSKKKEVHITIHVHGDTLANVDPPSDIPCAGDKIVWKTSGPLKQGKRLLIFNFRDPMTGKPKNPMNDPEYPIDAPGDNVPGDVNDQAQVGRYKYTIRLADKVKAIALASRYLTSQSAAGQVIAGTVPKELLCALETEEGLGSFVMALQLRAESDSELDPEIQIGG
jgi:hypothetical protein